MKLHVNPSPLAGEGGHACPAEASFRRRKRQRVPGEGAGANHCRLTSERRRGRGFTLVEVIVVIAIIGILASVVIVRYAGKTDQARVAAAKAQVTQIEGAVIEFQANCKRLPRSLDELVSQPGDCPDWAPGGYFKSKGVPKDPWGHEFVYRQEGSNFEIICLGADGQEGGTGYNRDISSSNPDGGTQ